MTLLATYQVVHRIDKSKDPHAISEELIIPAAIDLISTMIEGTAQQLVLVPLSNDSLENKRMVLPSNLQRKFLQHLSKLESKYSTIFFGS